MLSSIVIATQPSGPQSRSARRRNCAVRWGPAAMSMPGFPAPLRMSGKLAAAPVPTYRPPLPRAQAGTRWSKGGMSPFRLTRLSTAVGRSLPTVNSPSPGGGHVRHRPSLCKIRNRGRFRDHHLAFTCRLFQRIRTSERPGGGHSLRQ